MKTGENYRTSQYSCDRGDGCQPDVFQNITTFLLHLVKRKVELDLERDDEIIHNTLLTRNGKWYIPGSQLLDLPDEEEES